MKVAGPYLSANTLFESVQYAEFEGYLCRVPAKPEEVLKSYYGENWEVSPFPTKEVLHEKYGNEWYSNVHAGITVLKHISNVIYVDDTYKKNQ